MFLVSAGFAWAGLPRDAEISADEQTADETTGVTIARGHATFVVRERGINGTADVIELRPQIDEILFKGRAVLTVGHFRYENDTVACTLDFIRCHGVDSDQPLPPIDPALMDPAPVLGGSATISPR